MSGRGWSGGGDGSGSEHRPRNSRRIGEERMGRGHRLLQRHDRARDVELVFAATTTSGYPAARMAGVHPAAARQPFGMTGRAGDGERRTLP